MFDFYPINNKPFNENIFFSRQGFFRKVSYFRKFRKFFIRWLYVKIKLRNSKNIDLILNEHKKILWIQLVDSALGDSLMDLSSRALLKNKRVDFLTNEKLAKIYQEDEFFDHIFTNPVNCNHNYDLIIVTRYRKEELQSLSKEILSTPHVYLHGYYEVDFYNRIYFSFFRMNQLLSQENSSNYIYDNARPYLPITKQDKQKINSYNLSNDFIVMGVGGEDDRRTFTRWNEVVNCIFLEGLYKTIILIGESNSRETAKDILNSYPENVIDLTNKLSFNESAEVINRGRAFICCDGGLLHAANAVSTPVVALFYQIDPRTRLVKANASHHLSSKKNINNIHTSLIINKIKLLSNSVISD